MADHETVFLFDVDNTLLDNDRVTKDLKIFLEKAVGPELCTSYWRIFEELRLELGYADYLGALQRYRIKHHFDQALIAVSTYLVNYPFANRLFPNSLDVVERCSELGTVVILTDGDVVFQPRKIDRSGLFDAFDGNVLIYIHKETEISEIERCYPAKKYVLIDDKVRILAAVKEIWGDRVTTVFPRQGHYALDLESVAKYPTPDITIERIGDLLTVDRF